MTVEYTIPAIPTVYRGRRYRSRLEAKWAAFFDLLGWQHEYEPMDLGRWSPDFAITGMGGAAIWAEVKPVSAPDADVIEKIATACVAPDAREHVLAGLLLGLAPWVHNDMTFIGWAITWPVWPVPSDEWQYARAGLDWPVQKDRPVMRPDILIHTGTFNTDKPAVFVGIVTGRVVRHDEGGGPFYPEHDMRLWAEACNAVQWQPGGVS